MDQPTWSLARGPVLQWRPASEFGSGMHKEVPIDSTIQGVLDGNADLDELPQMDVFEADDRLHSINNRRLFVWRVLASKKKCNAPISFGGSWLRIYILEGRFVMCSLVYNGPYVCGPWEGASKALPRASTQKRHIFFDAARQDGVTAL
jgi:hypothetical protein